MFKNLNLLFLIKTTNEKGEKIWMLNLINFFKKYKLNESINSLPFSN